MTKIATIYDAIADIVETSLPGYTRLPNPYEVDENIYLYLQKGYGIAIGPGFDTERYVGCLVSWERTFSIMIIHQLTTTQNNISTRETIEKSILDDHDVLRKAFYLNSHLNQNAIKSTIISDSGISFIVADSLKFIGLEMVLSVEYQEDPND